MKIRNEIRSFLLLLGIASIGVAAGWAIEQINPGYTQHEKVMFP